MTKSKNENQSPTSQAGATVMLKPIVPRTLQLRGHDGWPYTALKIFFYRENNCTNGKRCMKESCDDCQLYRVGLADYHKPSRNWDAWKHYEFRAVDTRELLESSGLFTSKQYFPSVIQGRETRTKVILVLQDQRDGQMQFTMHCEEVDNQAVSMRITKWLPFEETKREAYSLDLSRVIYNHARKAEEVGHRGTNDAVRNLIDSLYWLTEVDTLVYEEIDEKAPEDAERKSRKVKIPRDPKEMTALTSVVNELLGALTEIDSIDGLVPRKKYLDGIADTLQGFRKELRSMRKAPAPGPGQKARNREVNGLAEDLVRSLGINPEAVDEPESSTEAEAPKPTAPPPAPKTGKKSFKDIKKPVGEERPRTLRDQLQPLVQPVIPTEPVALATQLEETAPAPTPTVEAAVVEPIVPVADPVVTPEN
ncbi:MAG: hypothetical protein WC866_04065 [Patescibacteria group bacterium]|jgi:hypothetical protein